MNRLQTTDLGLGALALLAIGASALAVGGTSFARSPSPTLTSNPTASTAAATASPTPADLSGTPSASSTSTPTATATQLTPLPTTSAADLVILGDATSNDIDEWVNELGAQLGESRRVRVQRANQETLSSYNAPITYGSADPTLQVWNASVDDPKPLNATSVQNLVPKATDLVVISQGRGADVGTITADLDKSLAAIRSAYPKLPVAVVLQPDDGSSSKAVAAVGDWAVQNGLPTIDVAKAFSTSGAGLQGSDGTLSARGTVLWAQTVAKAIIGN